MEVAVPAGVSADVVMGTLEMAAASLDVVLQYIKAHPAKFKGKGCDVADLFEKHDEKASFTGAYLAEAMSTTTSQQEFLAILGVKVSVPLSRFMSEVRGAGKAKTGKGKRKHSGDAS